MRTPKTFLAMLLGAMVLSIVGCGSSSAAPPKVASEPPKTAAEREPGEAPPPGPENP